MKWTTLSSSEDASVNHVLPTEDGGHWESRFVQRTSDYWICYLSSHTGCAHSCRFCHLTATRQTMMTSASMEDYLAQAALPIRTYRERLAKGLEAAQRMHFNFMSRGEALSNPTLLNHAQELYDRLGEMAQEVNLPARFLVSSILPRDFNGDLAEILADERASIFYSLYSLNPAFRKRWLPKALPGEVGLDLLTDYQRKTGRLVVLHWAFIEGQNDSEQDVDDILEAVAHRGIKARFNLVRYNPHDARHGVEPNDVHLQSLFDRIQKGLGNTGSRIVPRVGFDVKASCGMFIEPQRIPEASR